MCKHSSAEHAHFPQHAKEQEQLQPLPSTPFRCSCAHSKCSFLLEIPNTAVARTSLLEGWKAIAIQPQVSAAQLPQLPCPAFLASIVPCAVCCRYCLAISQEGR